MKKVIKYILFILIFSLLFAVLSEKISWVIFITGFALSILAFFITDTVLLNTAYINLFKFNFIHFLNYTLYLLSRIIISGFKAALLTIRGKVHLEFFRYQSDLTDDFSLNLLANSITLVPGTVTVNREENSLLVMQLCEDENACSYDDIKKMEEKIKKI